MGIEPSESCVLSAKRLYKGLSDTFLVGNHTALKSLPEGKFDLIFVIGVLHHIHDLVFNEFVEQALRLLKPRAQLVTFDPILHQNQSKLSKCVVKQDRGHWVRTEIENFVVIKKFFLDQTNSKIYSGLLRIPYDHILVNATKS